MTRLGGLRRDRAISGGAGPAPGAWSRPFVHIHEQRPARPKKKTPAEAGVQGVAAKRWYQKVMDQLLM
jgi:hypothetical protein